MYNKKLLKHFTNPKFFGKIKNADAMGKAGNPRCGDIMDIFLKVDKKTQKIKDIKFQTYGCAAAIAASDMICELVKGKKLDEALKVSFKDISSSLGEMPPLKIHCAQLAVEALRTAIKNYQSKKND